MRNEFDLDPIDFPRGIPDDLSSGYKYITNRWDGDGHSHSYFTLHELLNVDWSKYEKSDSPAFSNRVGWLDEFMETIEQMKSIDPDPKNVRCCFFFDN